MAQLIHHSTEEIGRFAEFGHFGAAGSPDAITQRTIDPSAAHCGIKALDIEARLFCGLAKRFCREKDEVPRGIEIQPGGAKDFVSQAGNIWGQDNERSARFKNPVAFAQ